MAEPRKNFPVEEDTQPRKILFLGDEKVGKTTFIARYCEHMRDYYRCDSYQGTFLVFTQFLLNSERFVRRLPVRFLDLPAGTTPESRKDQYPARVDLIVLCFAIDNQASFANVREIWLPEFRQYYPESQRFCLLGLKEDMRPELVAEDKMPVTYARGRLAFQRYGFSGTYLECSVKVNPQSARNCLDRLIDNAFIDLPIVSDLVPRVAALKS